MNGKFVIAAAALAVAGAMWSVESVAQDTTAASSATPEASSSAAAGALIHLHMPVHRAARHAAPKQVERPSVDAIGAGSEGGVPAPPPLAEAPAPAQPRSTAPARSRTSHKTQQSLPTIPFNFGEDSGAESQPPASPQAGAESPRPKRAIQAGPSSSVRRTDDDHAGLIKRGAVLFDRGVSNPSPAQFKGVKLLAADLSSALEAGASRVQLEAYGGAAGDKSSDARRLSLRRALAVRQLLIDSGVPSNRIDVRAMGGAGDKGPSDRVDVFVRSG